MSEQQILEAIDRELARPPTEWPPSPAPKPRPQRWKVVRQPAVLLARLHRTAVTVRVR